MNFFFIVLIGLSTGFTALAQENFFNENRPATWQSDAELTDVFFLNRDLGWTVGAQGVILRTTNGGQDWLEISPANPTLGPQPTLDEKFRALQSGTRTAVTGIADGSSNQFKRHSCRFESIHFVDELHGWIAGGYDEPYVDRSRAVILKTSDGGVSWRSVKGLFVPRLRRIHFSDRANGWAIGDCGNLFRTGTFYSSDGGETWSSQSSTEMENWIDGEKVASGFVNIATSGRMSVINNNRQEASVFPTGPQPTLNRLRMLDAEHGWTVGDRGAVLHTQNGGRSWSRISDAATHSETPAEVAELKDLLQHFDFNALAVSPGKIWFAGSPGSVVFSIDRQTGNIATHTTGVTLPIDCLHFVDDQNGWAVGMLGTILATSDGGSSWHVQRGQHRSVAMLGIAASERQLPLEALATFGIEENRICAAAVLKRDIAAQRSPIDRANQQSFSNAPPAILDSTTIEQAQQATERLSCTTVVQITPALQEIDNGSDQRYLQNLVRTIRMLRPNVVVSDSSWQPKIDQSGDTQLDPDALLKSAIVAAADPQSFPDQLRLAQLEPWSVDRLATRSPTGILVLDQHRMLPRAGSLIEDQIALSRALLNLPLIGTEVPGYRVQHFSPSNRADESDLFAGLSQLGKIVPTRESDLRLRGSLTAIQFANAKQKKLAEFARFELNTDHDWRIWNQQILSWVLSLDENVAGIWLAQLADLYLEQGKFDLAASSLEVLATRLNDHPLKSAAMTWLVQFNASDELGQIEFQRFRLRQQQQELAVNNGQIGNARIGESATQMTQTQSGGVTQLVWTPVAQTLQYPGSETESDSAVALASLEEEIETDLEIDAPALNEPKPLSETEIEAFFQSRWQRASQYLTQLSQRDPELVSGRTYRSLEAQLYRKSSGSLAAQALLKQLALPNSTNDGLDIAARRELQLDGTIADIETMDAVHCRRITERPQLDGILNEEFWQTMIRNEVAGGAAVGSYCQPEGGSEDDRVLFAYDDQFLYVAIECHKLAGQFYQSINEPRPRDADLSNRDRVAFSLDVDRDYRSSNDFVVDYRGWCNDRCCGSDGWNPQWYISHREDQQTWTIELAIPLEQIVPGKIPLDSVWAFRVVRLTGNEINRHTGTETSLTSASEGNWSASSMGWQKGLDCRPGEFKLLKFDSDYTESSN